MIHAPPPALLASDLSRRVVDSAVWTIGVRAVGAALQGIVFVCLARLLTPSEFGTYAMALVVVNLAGIVAQSGLRTALIQARTLNNAATSASLGGMVLVGMLGWGTIAATAQLGLAQPLANVLTCCGLNFYLLTLAVVPLALLQRALRFRELMSIELVGSFLGSAVVTLLLAAWGAGVWSLVMGGIVRDGLIAALALARCWPGIGWPRRGRGLRPLAAYGGTLTLTNIVQYIAQNVDFFIVGQVLGARALGFYSRAFYMTGRLNLLLVQGLHGVLLAAFSRADRARLRSGYLRATRVLSAVAFPLFACLALAAHDLVGLLLGETWLELVPTLRICCLLAAWPSLSSVADAVLKATAELKPQLWRHALHCVLVVLGALLGASYGPAGAATGVTLASFIVYALLTRYVLRHYQIRLAEYARTLLPGILLAGLMGARWWAISLLP